ncbi:L-threonylcarbamoyladenylate synthase [Rhodovulum adriaticum]|uniref:Threonylcarbamoyl-AMP synthase n=1 Tax=Rhodovulum adriaticum TaxID=35804 RepID=A0A4R2NKM8_RHOAD|nr:L-threonylcarbamoyladenylate synthase [Rhodovulum adriaticum]MBK1635460.1 threonylcarbamoyl-AMP synthase [Rhodovulum adriaticum]TCP22031.1 translation factor SUA5 [Rhodovulum adriaticum]
MPAEILTPDPPGLARAAAHLRGGGLVAFPTETVYGLGADATDDRAVAAIFQAKGRPRFNPLIVHLPDMDSARRIARFSVAAERLADTFWPGALTLVLPLRPGAGISPLVTAGLDTVALRVPDHPVARGLLGEFGGPVAAPSANPSGAVSPTRAAHVIDGLGDAIAAVVDGGACPVGVESTIVGFDPAPVLLRPGGLPVEAIEACLGERLGTGGNTAKPNAPGQLSSHYAPGARVVLDAATPPEGAIWLGFGPDCAGAALNLSPTGDLVEAAANLFHALRALDVQAAPGQVIAVAPVPDHGLGRAINDRLRRAAAPRG